MPFGILSIKRVIYFFLGLLISGYILTILRSFLWLLCNILDRLLLSKFRVFIAYVLYGWSRSSQLDETIGNVVMYWIHYVAGRILKNLTGIVFSNFASLLLWTHVQILFNMFGNFRRIFFWQLFNRGIPPSWGGIKNVPPSYKLNNKFMKKWL